MTDVLQELSEDFLTCCICLKLFTEPKQLPCLHSFCRNCLSRHIETSDRGGIIAFPCPVCRKVVHPPGNEFSDPADDFPDNFYIASLVNSVKAKTNSATNDEVQSSQDSPDPERCPRHPAEEVEGYCPSKEVPVCSFCRLTHDSCSEDHMGFQAVQTIISSKRLVITDKAEELHKSSKDFSDALTETPYTLRRKKDEVMLQISEHFSEVKNKFSKYLLQKENELQEKLKELVLELEEEGSITDATKTNDSISDAMKDHLSRIQGLDYQKPFGIMNYFETLEKDMEKFNSDIESLKSKFDVSRLKYSPNSEFVNTVENVQIGDIQFSRVESDSKECERVAKAEEPTKTRKQSMEHVRSYAQPTAPPMDMPNEAYAYVPERSFSPAATCRGPLPGRTVYAPRGAEATPGTQAPVHNHPPQTSPPYNNPQTSTYRNTSSYRRPVTCNKAADKLYLSRVRSETDREHDLKLVPIQNISCRLPFDRRACKIVGITTVKKDIFVLVDRFNKNLKIIQMRGPEVKYLQLPSNSEPWDATRVLTSERDEIAVTIPEIKTISFICYSTIILGLQLSHNVRTRIGYSSLGCINADKLVGGVCPPFGAPCVDVITMKGQILQSHTNIVVYPRSIDTSPEQIIAVSDWKTNEVILMKETGQIISRYKGGPDGKMIPVGVTFFEKNFFVIMDRLSGCLHKIRSTGQLESMVKVDDNAFVVACVPSTVYAIKSGLAVIVGKGDSVLVYDGCF